MKISKISKIENKNFKIETSLLFDGILVGLFAGIVGASYRLLIGYSEHLVHYTAEFIKRTYGKWKWNSSSISRNNRKIKS